MNPVIKNLVAALYLLSATHCLFAQCSPLATAGQPNGEVSVTIAPEAEGVKAGNPVIITATFTNKSDKLMLIPMSTGWDTFTLIVKDESDLEPEETILGCRLHSSKRCGPDVHPFSTGSGSSFLVDSGSQCTLRITVSEEYKFDKPGAYYFQGDLLRGFLVTAPHGKNEFELAPYPRKEFGSLLSNKVRVAVTP